MRIEGDYTIKAPREKVWNVLLDPQTIAKCMPGCEEMKEIGPNEFEARMKIGIAAVKGEYTGKIKILEQTPPSHYKLSGEGGGTPGFIQGDVSIDLEEKGAETLIKYVSEAKVGGIIAGVGQRMIGGISKMIVGQFFKKMEEFVLAQG
jgi:carbon monoxide dehydrogenase subunit G